MHVGLILNLEFEQKTETPLSSKIPKSIISKTYQSSSTLLCYCYTQNVYTFPVVIVAAIFEFYCYILCKYFDFDQL